MKKAVFLISVFFLSFAQAGAQVTKKELRNSGVSTTKCPIVANLKSGKFTRLSRDFVCLKSRAQAAKVFTKSRDLSSAGNFQTLSEFTMSGQGTSNTPAFRVSNRPALLEYQYSGEGRFVVTLRRRADGRVLEKLVDHKGPLEGSTYILVSDVMYLSIDADPEAGQSFWDIDLFDAD